VVKAIGALVMRGNANVLRGRSCTDDSLFAKRPHRDQKQPHDSGGRGGETLAGSLSAHRVVNRPVQSGSRR
jgi:hypothetical protein